jgi:ATP-dependent Clp protease ATP-binding subunit ClpA
MRVLQRGLRRSRRAQTIGPAAPYLARGADVARGLGHDFVGTEHVLLALVRDADGGAVRVLARLAVGPDAVERTLARWLCDGGPPGNIDPEALAALGIDLEAVRARLEQSFGRGALEQTRAAYMPIAPRLKLALAHALDLAAAEQLSDLHVLLGMLTVRESVAARALAELGVTLEAAQAVATAEP